jgi:putative membrane protein
MRQDNRGLWIVLGVLALLVLLGATSGGGMMGPGMMGWYGGQAGAYGGGWRWGLGLGLGWLALLAFFGAVIVGIILLVRTLDSHSAHGPGTPPAAVGHDTALEVLRRRYAAGELTEEEYERMRGVLER